jgi:uncharacterized protein (DUF305 family)
MGAGSARLSAHCLQTGLASQGNEFSCQVSSGTKEAPFVCKEACMTTPICRTARLAAVLAAATLTAPLPALAQTTTGHENHAQMGDTGPASVAFMEANQRMHESMAIEFTGNADVDFIRGMIPHHQGAVEMARIVLDYGTDPEVRKLAEAVIAAQEAEIKWMEEWLAKNGG